MKLHFAELLRRQKIIARSIDFKLIIWILVAFALHITLIMYFEQIKFFDSFWLTWTTIMTVGYGDIAAKTVGGRLSTIILMYIGGAFIITKLAGDLFAYLYQKRENKVKGKWSYKMKNHIVIINHPSENPELFLKEMILEIKRHKDYSQKEIVLVSSMEELPISLQEMDLNWVRGKIHDKETMNKASVLEASEVIILATTAMDVDFDSYSFDIVDHLRVNGCKAYIIVEAVKSESKSRLIRMGADAVIKVMHGYPSAAARALTTKGSQEILENLFSHEGEECIRYDLSKESDISWNNLVLECMNKNVGMPIACITTDNNMLTSPINKKLKIKTLFIIIGENKDIKSNLNLLFS